MDYDTEDITIDPITSIIFYKGINMGLSISDAMDIKAVNGIDVDSMVRSLYNRHIVNIREEKIDEILK